MRFGTLGPRRLQALAWLAVILLVLLFWGASSSSPW